MTDIYQQFDADVRLPVVAGVFVFDSARTAEFMANEVPGVSVPASVLARIRDAREGTAAGQVGIAVAREVALGVRARASGVHVAAPGGRVGPALAVLDALA